MLIALLLVVFTLHFVLKPPADSTLTCGIYSTYFVLKPPEIPLVVNKLPTFTLREVSKPVDLHTIFSTLFGHGSDNSTQRSPVVS